YESCYDVHIQVTPFPYTTLFRSEGYVNIVVIPPASLKQQWINELQNKERWNLVLNRDFRIISQQDRESLEALIEDSESRKNTTRSEEHTSELQSRFDLVCRLQLE